MKMTSFCNTSVRSALIVVGLAVGSGVGMAYAAGDASEPKAHSDGLGAAVTDTAITAKIKTKLMGRDSLKKSDIDVTTTNGVVTLEGAPRRQLAELWNMGQLRFVHVASKLRI